MYGYDMALATMNILDQWLPTKIYIKKGVEGDIVENKCVSGIRTEEESITRVTMITMHRIHAINWQNKLITTLNIKQKTWTIHIYLSVYVLFFCSIFNKQNMKDGKSIKINVYKTYIKNKTISRVPCSVSRGRKSCLSRTLVSLGDRRN